MVKRPKKFVIVDDSSPAGARAKSREQLVHSKKCPKGRGGPLIFFFLGGGGGGETADRETFMN